MRNLWVLIVDDDQSVHDLVHTALEGKVEAIGHADNAADALEILKDTPYHCLFLDVDMPGMSGLDLLAIMQKEYPHIGVIMMTGNASIDVAISALRNGAYDFLVKPFESVELIRNALERFSQKLRLERDLEGAHNEINGLYHYYLSAQALAMTIALVDVQRAAVKGLSRLSGGATAVILSAEDEDSPLVSRAVFPDDEQTRTIPLTINELKGKQENRLALAASLRVAFKEGTGELPLTCFALNVGGQPHSILALEKGGTFHPVSEDVIALYIRQVEMALANGLLYGRLEDLSVKDPLTGLYNHRYFQDRLTEEVSRAQRHGHELAMLFIDIDDFKNLNDTHGHPVGDRVLVGVANMLRGDSRTSDVVVRARNSDVAARYGGEEFVMILPETHIEGAKIKADRVREAIANAPFPGADTQPTGAVTISVGVALYPTHASDKRSLIAAADKALYKAKADGKNRIAVAEEKS